MKRGEEWALPVRDRGPAKALARDYIDSRRRLSEYYMYVMVVMIVVLFIRTGPIQQFAQPIALVLIAFVVVDAWFLSRSLRKLIAQRLPGVSTRGLDHVCGVPRAADPPDANAGPSGAARRHVLTRPLLTGPAALDLGRRGPR